MRMYFILALSCVLGAFSASAVSENIPENAFFAYCIDTHDSMKRSLEEQARMLKELGYDGVGHLWLDHVEERLKTLDAEGLRLFQITIQVNIASEDAPYDLRLKEVLPLLHGREVQLCLLMGGMKPSDLQGDDRGVAIVRELAGLGEASGTQILLYPHANDWLETVDDAIRIAKKVNLPNVGIMFNLCHWLKEDKEEQLGDLLKEAMPWLRAVSINGADTAREIREGTGNWLQPLDSGSFDVGALLEKLAQLNYTGPVGLQCWGIEGDAKEHLSRSMAAWKKMREQLKAPQE